MACSQNRPQPQLRVVTGNRRGNTLHQQSDNWRFQTKFFKQAAAGGKVICTGRALATSSLCFLQDLSTKGKTFSSTWAFPFAALEAPPMSLAERCQACCHHSYLKTAPGQVRQLWTGSERIQGTHSFPDGH